jgi:hypothetical protein
MMMMLLFRRWLRDGLFPATVTVTVTVTVLAFPVMNVCVFCLDRINEIQKINENEITVGFCLGCAVYEGNEWCKVAIGLFARIWAKAYGRSIRMPYGR